MKCRTCGGSIGESCYCYDRNNPSLREPLPHSTGKTDLPARLRKLSEFDEKGNREHWMNIGDHRATAASMFKLGAECENACLALIFDALIEYVRYAPEVLASLDDGLHISLRADLVKALARLERLTEGVVP